MKHVPPRRLGGLAAATVAAGLLTAPTAAAADAAPDTTSPTVTVTSPDFPAGGPAAKYAGQKATFVLRTADPAPPGGTASGVACVRYGWSNLGVSSGCDAPGSVRPDADGTVTLTVQVLSPIPRRTWSPPASPRPPTRCWAARATGTGTASRTCGPSRATGTW